MAADIEHEILWNAAALGALRRPQLVSLSKKYGLKANGKNTEMVNRLHEFGQTLTPASKTAFDYGVQSRAQKNEQASPSKKLPLPEMDMSDDDADNTPSPASESAVPSPVKPMGPMTNKTIQPMPSNGTLRGRGSDAWEVLTSGDSSLISEQLGDESTSSTGNLPWKSAANGASLEDLESARESKGGSLKSLGSSLRRAASRSLSISRKHQRPASPDSKEIKPPTILSPVRGGEESPAGEDVVMKDEDSVPPSPASAIGVAKRHSTMSLHHRPSTIRLVSPEPPAHRPEIVRAASPDPTNDDELPLTGVNSVDAIKKRRSIQFLETSNRANQHVLNRRSMPVLLSPHAVTQTGNRVSSAPSPSARLYPDLAMIQDTPPRPAPESADAAVDTAEATTPGLPGTFPPSAKPTSPSSPSFVFGSGDGTSSAAFSDAGMKLLQEMQSKMGGTAFNPELLKGKKAEVNKLVTTNANLGSGPTGGWGLSASASAVADRFADVHKREFAKMASISSLSTTKTASTSSFRAAGTPGTKRKLEASANKGSSGSLPRLVNGLPAPAPAADVPTEQDKDEKEEGRNTKRAKTSTAPRYLASMSSIRGAGRAIVSKLSESVGPGSTTPRRMRSNMRGTERGSRFPFLGHKKTASDAKSVADSVTSDDYVLATAPGEKKAAAAAAVKSTDSATPVISKRISSLTSASTSKLSSASTGIGKPSTAASTGIVKPSTSTGIGKPRTASAITTSSTGTARVVSSTKGRTPPTSSGPPVTMVPLKGSAVQPKTSRPLPNPQPRAKASASTSPAPSSALSSSAPPSRIPSSDSLTSSRAASRNSSLLAPTAASMARMQATVKPPTEASAGTSTPVRRPLPRPPKSATAPGAPTTPGAPAPGVSIAGIAPQIPTMSPFGVASSRTNYLFESNFHFPPPSETNPNVKSPAPTPAPAAAATPTKGALPKTPTGIPRPSTATTPRTALGKPPTTPRGMIGKSPARATVSSAQRARQRESGIGSIKARGHRDDTTVAQRRADIKARHERMKQERELRAMLM